MALPTATDLSLKTDMQGSCERYSRSLSWMHQIYQKATFQKRNVARQ
jgi:hypothetical protein